MEIINHFSGFEVRFENTVNGVITNGADLAACLYFRNPTEAVKTNVWAEYRFKHQCGTGAPSWYLTESGVWQLIFCSEHQIAVKIQKWVFEEVLPAIRAKGGYISPDASLEQVKALQNKLSQMQTRLELTQSLLHQTSDYIQGLEISLERSDNVLSETVDYYKNRLTVMIDQSLAKYPNQSLSIKTPGWVAYVESLKVSKDKIASFLKSHERFTLIDFLVSQGCETDVATQRCAGHLLRKLGFTPKQVRENGTRVSYWSAFRQSKAIA